MPCSVCKKAGHNKTTCMVLIMKALDESRELVASLVEVARIAQLPTAKRTEKEGEALINLISTVALIAESKLARDKERKDEVESGRVKHFGEDAAETPEDPEVSGSDEAWEKPELWSHERCMDLGKEAPLYKSPFPKRASPPKKNNNAACEKCGR